MQFIFSRISEPLYPLLGLKGPPTAACKDERGMGTPPKAHCSGSVFDSDMFQSYWVWLMFRVSTDLGADLEATYVDPKSTPFASLVQTVAFTPLPWQ